MAVLMGGGEGGEGAGDRTRGGLGRMIALVNPITAVRLHWPPPHVRISPQWQADGWRGIFNLVFPRDQRGYIKKITSYSRYPLLRLNISITFPISPSIE